jgi:DNA-binding MurR/RpiR family transcriptional regulator
MNTPAGLPLPERVALLKDKLTPKSRRLAEYVLQNAREAVFMRARQLAAACKVSDATVIRFVHHLGYRGYTHFIQALRDLVDDEFTMMDRVDLIDLQSQDLERYHKIIFEEIGNLKNLYASLDPAAIGKVVDRLRQAPRVDVIGARLSYTYSYYLAWCLEKQRTGVYCHDGTSTRLADHLNLLPKGSLVVMVATSRYPKQLVRLGRICQRSGHELILIADSGTCPLAPMAAHTLTAPFKRFPLFNSPSTIACLINCVVVEMVARSGAELRKHQEKLETLYRENDIFYNVERD